MTRRFGSMEARSWGISSNVCSCRSPPVMRPPLTGRCRWFLHDPCLNVQGRRSSFGANSQRFCSGSVRQRPLCGSFDTVAGLRCPSRSRTGVRGMWASELLRMGAAFDTRELSTVARVSLSILRAGWPIRSRIRCVTVWCACVGSYESILDTVP